MKVGRNEPCPCGSGLKYKKCCLVGAQAKKVADLDYRRFRDLENQLIGRLFKHAEDVYGQSSIEEAWAEFHCWDDSDGYNPESPINQVFGPYYLFSWEIGPCDTKSDLSLSEKTICESFIETNRKRLNDDELLILEATNRSVFSFYNIVKVAPGEGFVLRNVFTQQEHQVVERSGSRGAGIGEIVFGSLFEIDGRHQVLAMSPYMLPPLAMHTLTDFRNEIETRMNTKYLTDQHIGEFDIEFREVFFSILDQMLNPAPPKLYNTDGDLLVPQTLLLEIDCPDKAFHSLKSVTAGILSEEDLRLDASIKDGRIEEVEIPWYKKPKKGDKSGPNTLLGTLKIIGKKLTVEVNSNKRARTIKKRIESKLGAQVNFKIKKIESIEGNLHSSSILTQAETPAIAIDQLPPEALAAVREMASSHWDKWYDDKIPALNGMTPKQAAKTKTGRELLEALLNSYEDRSDSSENLFKPDISQIRAKLRLD